MMEQMTQDPRETTVFSDDDDVSSCTCDCVCL